MQLATIADRLCVRNAGGWVDVARAVPSAASDLVSLLERRQAGLLAEAAQHPAHFKDDALLGVPLWPRSLIDCYAFEGHVKNARARRGGTVPAGWYERPVWYRTNHRTLVAPGGEVQFPAEEPEPDVELELAAIIGQVVRSPSRAEAEAAIFGYTLFADWSARLTQREAMGVGLGPNPGKDFASSLGPVVITPDEFGDPKACRMSLWVNDDCWCDAAFAEARWDFPELIAAVAKDGELGPGDVIGSGTLVGGSGYEQGRVLPLGAKVELREARLGQLSGIVARAPKRAKFWERSDA